MKIFLILLMGSIICMKEIHAQRDSVILEDGTVLYDLPTPKKPRNALFMEIFTNGGLYSLNYDRILFLKEKWGITGRAGIFFFPRGPGNMESAVVLEPNVIIGKEKFFFEGGFGFTRYIQVNKPAGEDKYRQSDWENYLSIRAGFRIQNRNENGLFFRAGLTPIFYYMDKDGSDWFGQILGGVGFGVSF